MNKPKTCHECVYFIEEKNAFTDGRCDYGAWLTVFVDGNNKACKAAALSMDSIEPNPCPFCGGKADIIGSATSNTKQAHSHTAYVQCCECGARGSVAESRESERLKTLDDCKKRAVFDWNCRMGEGYWQYKYEALKEKNC